MRLFEEVEGISPQLDITRSGNSVALSFYYGLSGYYDEEAGYYVFSGEADATLGAATGFASQFPGGDRPLMIDFTTTLTPGGTYRASYRIDDWNDGTSLSYEYRVTLLSSATRFTGSAFADVVFGSVGADSLAGSGGNDSMEGGGGNDTLLGGVGDDRLWGGDGADRLEGGGGADLMVGGIGSDTYVVDHINDIIDETGGIGIDKVEAFVDFSLLNPLVWGTVENVALRGYAGLNASGNAMNNTVSGNVGNNVLNGHSGDDYVSALAGNDTIYGGAGRDTLHGGAGADCFVFNLTPSAGNRDVVLDFRPVDDTIWLENTVFTRLGGNGVLAASAFHMGAGAADAADRIIYNPATGALIYDSNGSAAGGAVQFATLSSNLTLTNSDFLIV